MNPARFLLCMTITDLLHHSVSLVLWAFPSLHRGWSFLPCPLPSLLRGCSKMGLPGRKKGPD